MRCLVLRKDNRVLRTNAAACRATFATIVGLFDQNGFDTIDAVDTKQTKIDAFHALVQRLKSMTGYQRRVGCSSTVIHTSPAEQSGSAADMLVLIIGVPTCNCPTKVSLRGD